MPFQRGHSRFVWMHVDGSSLSEDECIAGDVWCAFTVAFNDGDKLGIWEKPRGIIVIKKLTLDFLQRFHQHQHQKPAPTRFPTLPHQRQLRRCHQRFLRTNVVTRIRMLSPAWRSCKSLDAISILSTMTVQKGKGRLVCNRGLHWFEYPQQTFLRFLFQMMLTMAVTTCISPCSASSHFWSTLTWRFQHGLLEILQVSAATLRC